MEMQNSSRRLVDVLRDVCGRRHIDLAPFCHEWVFELTYAGCTAHIFGYDFGLNSATAHLLAKDKAATSELLKSYRVPHVEHRLFLAPKYAHFVSSSSNWLDITAFFEECDGNVVCKTAVGTGGDDVFHARSQLELEVAVHQLFQKHRAICLSPYLDISYEYRIIVLNGEALLIFRKLTPGIVGDGVSTVQRLVAEKFAASPPTLARRLFDEDVAQQLDLDSVPASGQRVSIGWKHNLGLGGHAELVPAGPFRESVASLASRAAASIGLQFGSVDVVAVGESLSVLEINAGVMMESVARQIDDGPAIVTEIYERAICRLLGIPYES